MLRFIVASIGCLLLTGCSSEQIESLSMNDEGSSTIQVEATPVSFNEAGAPTVVFEAPGMHCEMCSAGVCKALKSAEGVVDVKADAETKLVTVAVDETTFKPETVIDAIAEANFGEATLVTEETLEEVASEEG